MPPVPLSPPLFEAVVDEAPLALALVDAAGRMLFANPGYQKLAAAFEGGEPAISILEAALPGGCEAMAAPDFAGFSVRELRIDAPGAMGGTAAARWFSCALRPVAVPGRDEACFLLTIDDASGVHQEHEKMRLAALRAHLLEEEHADVLRESLSAAVFRLEGPLNMMESISALLRHAEPAMAKRLETALADGRERLEELRRLIPLGRREAFIPVNLNEVLHDVLDVSTPRLLRDGITVSWQPTAILPSITGQPMRLHALFKALVDNAIDALSGRGWKTREMSLSTHVSENYVQVFIDDHGPGIAAALRLKVFEPFFTTRAHHGQHLGTGLSRALEIACEHGGALELSAAPGGGCRAFVELPAGHRSGGGDE
ncbi:MAG: nitrogen fixation negative regulator NifL [Azoarcus sp.]|jgi:nitrogen fixation negative regulator NifL|nr:nitrogen fixation negative regulator NifL [Azoarcus sp.]